MSVWNIFYLEIFSFLPINRVFHTAPANEHCSRDVATRLLTTSQWKNYWAIPYFNHSNFTIQCHRDVAFGTSNVSSINVIKDTNDGLYPSSVTQKVHLVRRWPSYCCRIKWEIKWTQSALNCRYFQAGLPTRDKTVTVTADKSAGWPSENRQF